MITILRKKGWELNNNDQLVNNLFKAIERNQGYCPCQVKSEGAKCPCTEYRDNNNCHCNLYVQKIEDYLEV